MLTNRILTALLWIAALLLSALACQAFTDMLLPPASTGQPPAIPSATLIATRVNTATCPDLTAQIMKVANYGTNSGDDLGGAQSSDREATYLVTYRVRGDRISNPILESVPADFLDEQSDSQAQQEAWDYFTALIPADERSMLAAYVIITDGLENIVGAVTQVRSADRWALEIDIQDAADARSLTYTVLHEFGHLLSLNEAQVTPSQAIFNNPENADLYEREAAACPQYFPGEGCSRPGSYINTFYDQFWTDIYTKWQVIDQEEDLDVYDQRLGDFYRKYRSRFISEYAVTSPEEDMAETWTYFILSPKPDGDRIAEQKVLFFYNYPELVRLRGEILANLCTAFPQQ